MWFHHLLLVKYVNEVMKAVILLLVRSPTEFFLCIITKHMKWEEVFHFHIFEMKHKKKKVARAREWCHREIYYNCYPKIENVFVLLFFWWWLRKSNVKNSGRRRSLREDYENGKSGLTLSPQRGFVCHAFGSIVHCRTPNKNRTMDKSAA